MEKSIILRHVFNAFSSLSDTQEFLFDINEESESLNMAKEDLYKILIEEEEELIKVMIDYIKE